MTRLMFDGVTAASVPAGAALYAGYVDGHYPSYDALKAKWPSALHVTITVNTSARASVLDIENGDASPEEAPDWVQQQRADGNPDPVCYMNEATWPAVRQAFAAQGVAEPLYWVAAYVDNPAVPPSIPAGAIAVQYYDFGGFDASLVADYWPGVDPAPGAPSSASTIVLEEDPVQIDPLSVHPGDYAVAAAPNATELVLVADGNDGAPATVRVASWVGDHPLVETIEVGGSAHHSVGHMLPTGCNGVTMQRQDSQAFAVGVAFK